jgi:hypothetical protein
MARPDARTKRNSEAITTGPFLEVEGTSAELGWTSEWDHIADNRLPLGGEDGSSISLKRAQTVGSACQNAPMKKRSAARRLLLRSAFKQPVADLLRYEALGALPCLVIVTAELEVPSEHDALGCCIDDSNPHNLHQRA